MSGGKQQEARAGVDYIKVNFHTDNSPIIDIIAPLSNTHHTLCNELCHLRSDILSYGYAVHVRKGVKASSEEIAEHLHQPQDHEAVQLTQHSKLEELVSQPPDQFDGPAMQEEFVDRVQNQLCCCALLFHH